MPQRVTDTDTAAQYGLAQHLRTATLMREGMLRELADAPRVVAARELFVGRDGRDLRPEFVHMRLWFAFLYVVVEGWQQRGLRDPLVAECIKAVEEAGELTALRRFRNAVFHLQNDPFTPKFTDVLARGLNAGMLTRLLALHAAYEAYFDRWRADADLSMLTSLSVEAFF